MTEHLVVKYLHRLFGDLQIADMNQFVHNIPYTDPTLTLKKGCKGLEGLRFI